MQGACYLKLEFHDRRSHAAVEFDIRSAASTSMIFRRFLVVLPFADEANNGIGDGIADHRVAFAQPRRTAASLVRQLLPQVTAQAHQHLFVAEH